MSNDAKPTAPKPAAKDDPAPAVKTEVAKPKVEKARTDGKPPFDERRLRYEDIAPHGKSLDLDELLGMLRDGLALVPANAALGMAAPGPAPIGLVPLFRACSPPVAHTAR